MKNNIFSTLARTRLVAFILFLVAACNSMDAAAQGELPDTTIQQILDAHNVYRQEVGIAALTWSPELAKFAQNWANELATNRRCEMSHRPSEDSGDPWKQKYGENIYSGGGTDWVPTILDGVGAWGKEKEDFNLDTKECKDGGICGHYTQIVWKNTTTVGCGIAVCADGNVIVVCNYDPSGNFNGEKPF